MLPASPELISGGDTNLIKKRRNNWIQDNKPVFPLHITFYSVSVHLRLVVDGWILHKTTLALCRHAPSV